MISYDFYDMENAEDLRDRGYKWIVKGFYNENVPFPHRKGKLAFRTKHRTDFSRDTEIRTASHRHDIGDITVLEI